MCELLLDFLLPFSLQDEEELEQLMKMDNETREVVREMRQKVDEAKSSLSSNRSRGKVLDALMHQKKSGRIPGIFGRLVKSCYNILICKVSEQQLSLWASSYSVHSNLSHIIYNVFYLTFINSFSGIKNRRL